MMTPRGIAVDVAAVSAEWGPLAADPGPRAARRGPVARLSLLRAATPAVLLSTTSRRTTCDG